MGEPVEILIVDDSPTQAAQLKHDLEVHGYRVSVAGDGDQALSLMAKRRPDVVISDIMMPGMDGYELCRRIKAGEKSSDVPVILLTGLSDAEDVVKGLECGADNFLVKPYDPPYLLSRVQTMLANRQLKSRDRTQMAMEFFFAGKKRSITSDRLQILNLLLSTYETAVQKNGELKAAQDELKSWNERLESEVRERTAELTERMKEVQCLYGVSSLIAETGKTIDDVLGASVELIPPGWQYPEITCARIAFDGREFATTNFRETAWKQVADIVILAEKRGAVEVCHLEERPELAEGPFLKEKRALIIDIARQLGVMVQHRLAEAALRESEERYAALFRGAAEGILVADMETKRFVYANPAICRILGYSEEELKCLGVQDIHPAESLEHVLGEFGAQARGEKALSPELPCRRKDGSVIYADVTASGVILNERRCNVGFFSDVTERKRVEEALHASEERFRQSQKLEAIGQLAGGIAHDFNNMLAAIIGYCDLLLMNLKEADPMHSDLVNIKRCADRAAGLTRQLLAFSRKQTLQPKVLDLNEVAADLDNMLRRLIGEDIHLALKAGADLGRVKADPGQIEQVIMNLAVNARDAMPDGGKLMIETANVELDEEYASTHVNAQPGPHVMIAVTDNGCGMSKETQSHIFEPFFTTKGQGKGTGLGLSTVYGIVKQSGGSIWVYSELGKGTTFKIYLPRVEGAPDKIVREKAAIPKRGTETVLVVEDEDTVRDLVTRILKMSGYKVLEAPNGGEALLICEKHLVDLLITDVVMPSMGGRELAERAGKIRPGLKVLYTSGYTDNAIVHQGILDAGTPFIQKPYSVSALLAKVREVLERQ